MEPLLRRQSPATINNFNKYSGEKKMILRNHWVCLWIYSGSPNYLITWERLIQFSGNFHYQYTYVLWNQKKKSVAKNLIVFCSVLLEEKVKKKTKKLFIANLILIALVVIKSNIISTLSKWLKSIKHVFQIIFPADSKQYIWNISTGGRGGVTLEPGPLTLLVWGTIYRHMGGV